MKIITVIARFLLGFIFLVFGLNGFLHFIPSSPPIGTAGQFVGALFVSHYLVPIFLLQIISAVLLLVNRYVPLALTLLAPIIVNILLIHILMLPAAWGNSAWKAFMKTSQRCTPVESCVLVVSFRFIENSALTNYIDVNIL